MYYIIQCLFTYLTEYPSIHGLTNEGLRLFAALIMNTCTLVARLLPMVARLLPMGRSLVTRLEYMYVFDHFCHCTQELQKFMMTWLIV